ncbi:aldehyde ferredoxin oxidoreductase family protein [Ruminococcus sp. CLA-AA-H200]|uniref:Aldehyde ferredoxin oxidoreductase family protein n=1 Tax=Ruminococcus turbiniformis TaxID=2881258 RepID=A0ABS8FS88_9FIRM|nr:aldehyde ferredoxin oxidoreductase family protein [Ruminococcus turbiniformis]MCC2252855.1 aldehyde ferredoxin oxidoreductase family protein [Ruminococcus turbiniformis]
MATEYGGYMGKVLKVNLTTREVSEYPFSDEERRLFIGGKTMAAKILGDHLTGKEKAFSEENLLVVTTGPLTGSGAPSSSRFNISTLSPQTGYITSSNCGGHFGYYLKKAGMDALILTGRSEKPIWIEINNDKVIFHDADDIWGMKTGATQEALDDKLRMKNGRVRKNGKICIGPAGENLVLYSCIVSNERVSGRGGTGAVMGWMRLKAVCASGNKEVPVYDKEKMVRHTQKWFRYLRKHPLTGSQLPKLGTAGLVSAMQMKHILSTKNYTYGQYDEFEKVSGEELAEKYNIVNKGCLTCPIRCARTVEVDGQQVKGPELETLVLLGGGILNDNLESIMKWNYEMDELGLDTISCANTISYAMEANEKGLWDNGLKFSETEQLSELFEDIAYRRGIGDELAQGSRRLADKYGGKEFAVHAKGMELAAYEPRKAVGLGLGYATSNRGGCHLNGGYLVILEGLGLSMDQTTYHSKADLTMLFQDLMEMISATGQCLFTSYAFFPTPLMNHPNAWYTKLVNKVLPYTGPAVRIINKYPEIACFHLPVFHHTKGFEYTTGMKMTFGQYIRCGERGFNLEREVNRRFGVNANKDALPKKLTDTLQDPNDPNSKVPLEKLKKVYYHARGWSQDGLPTKRLLRKLKIGG